MYAVAIARLGSSIDQEATALATDLVITPYEARLALAGGVPAVVLLTPERARALDCVARLRARGHQAVACDAAAILPGEEMTALRRFRFDDDGVAVEGAKLPYDDILALVRAQADGAQLCYVFRRRGGPPWILRDHAADYTSLGDLKGATQAENFRTTVQILRERAPGAVYDEQLLAVRKVPDALRGASGWSSPPSPEAGLELLAHVIALALARQELAAR